MERKNFDKPIHTKITTKELSVSDRIIGIRDVLRTRKSVNFEELFEVYNKNYVVVTFLSILEMSKNKEIEIVQDNNFSNILIKGCEL